MNIYFLFSNVNDEYICKYIYTSEANKVFSYSYDEGYIVKSEETAFKSLADLEAKYNQKSKGKKGVKQTPSPVLKQKEFLDVRQSLFFLNGSLDNFEKGIPSRKRLPEIINPYDMDFESSGDFDEDLDDLGERGFEESEEGFEKSDLDFDEGSFDDSFDDDSLDDDDLFDDHDPYKDNFDNGNDNYDDDDDDYFRK